MIAQPGQPCCQARPPPCGRDPLQGSPLTGVESNRMATTLVLQPLRAALSSVSTPGTPLPSLDASEALCAQLWSCRQVRTSASCLLLAGPLMPPVAAECALSLSVLVWKPLQTRCQMGSLSILVSMLAMLGFAQRGSARPGGAERFHGGCVCISWELPPVQLLTYRVGAGVLSWPLLSTQVGTAAPCLLSKDCRLIHRCRRQDCFTLSPDFWLYMSLPATVSRVWPAQSSLVACRCLSSCCRGTGGPEQCNCPCQEGTGHAAATRCPVSDLCRADCRVHDAVLAC